MRTTLAGCLMPHPPIIPDVCLLGPIWTQQVVPNIRYHGLAYGNGVFLAGGDDGAGNAPIATSSDGITWASHAGPSLGAPIATNCIAAGAGRFVAAGGATNVAWSSDNGVSWNTVGLVASKTLTYFGGGIFVLVSNASDKVHISADGATWSQKTLPSNTTWATGGYGAGRHILVAGDRTTAHSDDAGLTWSSGGNVPVGYGSGKIAYGNGVWVVLNTATSNTVAYSTNGGASWSTASISGAAVNLTDIHFQQGVFLVCDNGGSNIAVSVDGVTWTIAADMPAAFTGYSVFAYNGAGRYVAVQATNPGTTIAATGDC